MSFIKRDLNRSIIVNDKRFYKSFFIKRDINGVEQYDTPVLYYPEQEEINDFEIERVVWKVGDRFSKLAHEHYGNAKMWWVIAWYNKKPTDSDVEYGEVIEVPFPLRDVLSAFGY
jgi:nucleoid-associated protein YgaU